jgi:site-specific DNA-adenine methylase
MKTASPLSYFGSDSGVAAKLGSMFDHCSHVTIPFVGGASILPHIKAKGIVANDLNEEAINFYRVLSGWYGATKRDELITCCERTLSHPRNIREAMEAIASLDSCETNSVYLAWAYWAICWIGRKGRGGTKSEGGKPSIRWKADGGNNASRIRAAAADLESWSMHFRRCEWMACDFREVLTKAKDDQKCGIYVDAPWFGAGGAYRHAFNDQDHVDLANQLSRFEKSTVVIRYGDCDSARELYSSWKFIETSSRTQSNDRVQEVWITNKEATA